MTIIHAFPRKPRPDAKGAVKPHTVEVAGKRLKFIANDEGHYVCDVTDGAAAKRLLAIRDHYRVYGEPAPEPEPAGEDEPASPYILTDGDDAERTVDLRTLDKAALLAFGREHEISLSPNAKEETLRDKIAAFFKVD